MVHSPNPRGYSHCFFCDRVDDCTQRRGDMARNEKTSEAYRLVIGVLWRSLVLRATWLDGRSKNCDANRIARIKLARVHD